MDGATNSGKGLRVSLMLSKKYYNMHPRVTREVYDKIVSGRSVRRETAQETADRLYSVILKSSIKAVADGCFN